MKKIPTLFKKDERNLSRVIDSEPVVDLTDPSTEYYLKIDGTACAIINGKLYTRYDAKLFKRKKGKIVERYTVDEVRSKLPEGSIECQEPDKDSGHWPHWIPVQRNTPNHKHIVAGYKNAKKLYGSDLVDGTYELIGPMINKNIHNAKVAMLIKHQHFTTHLPDVKLDIDFDENLFKQFDEILENVKSEGLVIYQNGEPVAKIRQSDYGRTIDYAVNIIDRIELGMDIKAVIEQTTDLKVDSTIFNEMHKYIMLHGYEDGSEFKSILEIALTSDIGKS